MTNNDAFTIISINHPDDIRAPKTRYAVNSYTHRNKGRRPKQIVLKKQLAVSWTSSREDTPDEPSSCGDSVSDETGPSACLPQSQRSSENGFPVRDVSPLTIEFSGMRRDPFNSYPIEVRGCVEGAVDFWLKDWVPSQIPGMAPLFTIIWQRSSLFCSISPLRWLPKLN